MLCLPASCRQVHFKPPSPCTTKSVRISPPTPAHAVGDLHDALQTQLPDGRGRLYGWYNRGRRVALQVAVGALFQGGKDLTQGLCNGVSQQSSPGHPRLSSQLTAQSRLFN